MAAGLLLIEGVPSENLSENPVINVSGVALIASSHVYRPKSWPLIGRKHVFSRKLPEKEEEKFRD